MKRFRMAALAAVLLALTARLPARADSGAALDQSAVDAVMKKYDRESNTRVWEGWQKWVVYAVMAAFSLFVIYVTLFASWLDLIRYPSFMGGVLLIGYLTFPAKKGVQRVNHIPWGDWLLMLLGTAAFFYAVVNAKDLTVRLGMSQIRPYEIAIAVVVERGLRGADAQFMARQIVDAYINIQSYNDTSENEMALLK